MAISNTTLAAIYLAKYTEILGSANLLTLNASALATTSLSTPQSLLINVLPADSVVEAYGQIIRIKEAFPALFQHAIITWDGSELYELENTPFGFSDLRYITTPTGAAVYVDGVSNNMTGWRREFPDSGRVKG